MYYSIVHFGIFKAFCLVRPRHVARKSAIRPLRCAPGPLANRKNQFEPQEIPFNLGMDHCHLSPFHLGMGHSQLSCGPRRFRSQQGMKVLDVH